MSESAALAEFALRMGDSALILGHRLSEWTGHAPVLEEELASANVALDLLGQAQLWLSLAGELEGRGRSADDLAYLREPSAYRNLLLAEQLNGDFGHTLVRQFLFDAWNHLLLDALCAHPHARVAEIAEKASKEVRYHLERSSDWVVRLGDGTDESHRRVGAALEILWPYTGELFVLSASCPAATIVIDARWRELVDMVLQRATLDMPNDEWAQSGGIDGRHTEHLGKLLAEMQSLQRAYPGASW
jgi:ring-1,2-phenylacetyl-CoA epoxidase subunit PaaC